MFLENSECFQKEFILQISLIYCSLNFFVTFSFWFCLADTVYMHKGQNGATCLRQHVNLIRLGDAIRKSFRHKSFLHSLGVCVPTFVAKAAWRLFPWVYSMLLWALCEPTDVILSEITSTYLLMGFCRSHDSFIANLYNVFFKSSLPFNISLVPEEKTSTDFMGEIFPY